MSSKKKTAAKKTASKPAKPMKPVKPIKPVNEAKPLGSKKAKKTAKPAENKPDPKKDEKKPPVRVQRETKHLKCELTPDEYNDRTQQAAQAWAEKSRLEEQLEASKKDFKGKISTYEAQHAALQNEILNRCTYRDIDCERVFDYSKKVVYVTRLDTKQEVERRAMTTAEMQTTMPWGSTKDEKKQSESSSKTKEHKGPLTAPLAEVAKIDAKTQQELKDKAADRIAENGTEDVSQSEKTTQAIEDKAASEPSGDKPEEDDDWDDDDDLDDEENLDDLDADL